MFTGCRQGTWCPGEDSNLQGSLHWYLKPARLPIPPPGQGKECGARPRKARKSTGGFPQCQSKRCQSEASAYGGAGTSMVHPFQPIPHKRDVRALQRHPAPGPLSYTSTTCYEKQKEKVGPPSDSGSKGKEGFRRRRAEDRRKQSRCEAGRQIRRPLEPRREEDSKSRSETGADAGGACEAA